MADINDVIYDNLGLVYTQLNRFKLRNDQDAESFAYEALYNAVISYDEKSGNSFSTYATCVIANSLRTLVRHRKRKRQLNVMSYNEHIDNEANEEFVDVLVGYESVEDIMLREELHEVLHEALEVVYTNISNETAKRIFVMWYSSNFEMTQQQIAAALNISQPTVSKNLSIIKYKLKQELEDYL